jgi:beta-mannosidase
LLRIELPDWRFGPAAPASPDLPAVIVHAFLNGALTARVPGNVHDDLLAHGLISDPYLGVAEQTVQWVGRQDWVYSTRLPEAPAGFERVDLVADGLDTFAAVEVGPREIGRTRDQHRSHRFDVTPYVRRRQPVADAAGPAPAPPPGPSLTITFESAHTAAERVRAQVGDLPGAYDEPYQYVRKMASNFGWDWGPTVVTAGVWRDIRLEAWSTARIESVRPHVSLDSAVGDTGEARVDVGVERTASDVEVTLELVLLDPDGQTVARGLTPVTDDHASLTLRPGAVRRWWPHGMGEQPLYRLEVTLRGPEGVLDETTRTLGFRHVALRTVEDSVGEAFGLEVAGRPVFARGYNWIPDDLLVTRVTADRYRERLKEAVESGANLVRVWGGGLFEQDPFYDACDELGLMVWQDCPFACAAYPETDEIAAEVEAETRDNVTRLMSHPSLVLWNGNNENFMAHDEWGWPETLAGRGWGERYYFDILPRVIGELDPGRPYWPGSPYSGAPGRRANDPAYGCHHSWTVWNQVGYSRYTADRPRFVAEFGWCGAPAWATLRDAIGEECLRPWDPVLMWHYKDPNANGQDKIRRSITDAFHEPSGFDEWHYATQVCQARAVGFGLDYWRGLWPHCQGAVVWQLNDCWPVISWAAVDAAGRRKPVWHAVRRSFLDRIATLEDGPDGPILRLVNQASEPWTAHPLVRRLDVNTGEERARWSRTVTAPPDQVVAVTLPQELAPGDGAPGELGRALGPDEFLCLDAEASSPDPATRRVMARPDRDLVLTPSRWRVAAVRLDGVTTAVRVTAETPVRDLLLQPDRLGATGDAPLVTLLPGESYEWHLTGFDAADPSLLAAPALLDAASVELGARRPPVNPSGVARGAPGER